ncbi:ABC transporter transmembrane domain-containing protein [Anaerolineales bacterium HSG6]|nr:ABC transporter transmembrane domain-containing protein [Anaerolineales bacterium HSG6]
MIRPRHRVEDTQEQVPVTRERLAGYLRLLQYVRPYTGRMILALIALAIGTSLGLLLPLVIQGVVDVVFFEKDMALVNRLTMFLVIIFMVQGVTSFINRYNIAYVGERVVADLRNELYSHLMRLSLRYFADTRTGEIVSRVTNDVTILQSAVTQNLVTLLQQAMMLIGGTFFLFWLDWQLTAVILGGIPVVTLTMVYLGRKIRRAATQVQDYLAEASGVLDESIGGIRIVKSFAREEYEIERFGSKIEQTFEAAMYRAKISAILAPIIGFMAFMSITVTIWFGSYQVLQGRLSPGELVAYLFYTMMVGGPIAALSGLYSQFQSALGATQRLFELLDLLPDITDKPNAPVLPHIIGNVSFEQVSFQYDSSMPILHDIDLQVTPGQVVALVGPSGSGKSTLVNLVPRFYDVTAGRILIDGHDIRTVTNASLREQIGIVPQDAATFSGSIAENIRYGNLSATQAEIESAAQAANAHEFISKTPNGYETLVGERGIKLSGGQRQRVAIARAILKDPRILILDEATSSLDSESERLVQDALERLMQSRTTFVIAHRLSTITNADWIVVLEEGHIVEQGQHDELLALPDGLYRKFHAMQFQFEARIS